MSSSTDLYILCQQIFRFTKLASQFLSSQMRFVCINWFQSVPELWLAKMNSSLRMRLSRFDVCSNAWSLQYSWNMVWTCFVCVYKWTLDTMEMHMTHDTAPHYSFNLFNCIFFSTGLNEEILASPLVYPSFSVQWIWSVSGDFDALKIPHNSL